MEQGLSHIPLEPTSWDSVKSALSDLWSQLHETLYEDDMYSEEARTFILNGLNRLLTTSKNRYDTYLRSHPWQSVGGTSLWEYTGVSECIDCLSIVGFWSGIDKAGSTWMWRCIINERLQAFARLDGSEFVPVLMEGASSLFLSLTDVLQLPETVPWLDLFLPELNIANVRLPYIFSLYKEHKDKHRWLVNAHDCVYSEVACIVQITTEAALEVLREVVGTLDSDFADGACSFPAVNSMFEVLLSLPSDINSVFSCDVTRAYEALPVTDVPDSLQVPVAWVFREAFGLRNTNYLCVRWSLEKHMPVAVTWENECPEGNTKYIYLAFTMQRIIDLSIWLMSHAYVVLGDRVWRQILGICMGYSCSPVWCTVYLLYYEFHFIQRLRKLDLKHLLKLFSHWYRYIDDCLILNCIPHQFFFNPQVPRTADNPFWIYPLDILSITVEVDKWFPYDNPWLFGQQVNFLSTTLMASGENGTFTLRRYIKRASLPFSTVQFISFKSNRPISDVLSTPLSQVLPYLYVNSDVASAQETIVGLIDYLVRYKGYPRKALLRRVTRALTDGQYPGLLYDHTLIEL